VLGEALVSPHFPVILHSADFAHSGNPSRQVA